MPKVSRREFLKFMAAGGIVAAAGFAGISSLVSKNNSRQATAQTPSPWALGPETFGHAVHVALLRDGRVLYVGGSGWKKSHFLTGKFQAGIWDPSTGDHSELLPMLDEDLFCCGQVPLENGNILLAGGTLEYKSEAPNNRYWGLKAVYEFDVDSNSFIERTSMAHGRWYPTLVELPDGRILTVEGYDEFGYHNLLTEIYNPATGTWAISYDPNASRTYTVGCDSSGCANVPGAPGPSYGGAGMGVAPGGLGLYPRMHLMPSGLVALVGQGATRRIWNPDTERWHGAGSMTKRSYGTSVLLPLQNNDTERGSILVCGGSSTSDQTAVNTAQIFEESASGFTFNVVTIDPMIYERRYCNPVILPTGKIIIFGGTGKANLVDQAVYVPEMFDPVNNTWTELPVHSIPRIYHSGALLLKDGRVWTMGTSYGVTSFETKTEIYSPDYCFQTRPVISGTPTGGEYGGTITIPTPDASNITAVSLLKVPTTTHHYNTDQRLIWLNNLQIGTDQVTVSAPINSKLAPPGYYMIHVLIGDVPSEGAMIHITSGAAQSTFYEVASPGDSYMTLQSGGDTRAGEEAVSGSALIGKQLKRWTVYLRKPSSSSNPSGDIIARIRNKNNDSNPSATFSETYQASTLTTSYQAFEFTLPSPYNIQLNDRLLIEYSGPNGVRVDAWNIEKFDGSKTRRVKYNTLNGYSGTAMNDKDTSGIMSSV